MCYINLRFTHLLQVRVRIPVGALPGTQVKSAFHPSGVGKSSTSLLAGVKAGRVHLCRVAGNTVWFHGKRRPIAVRWEPINSYTLLYLFYLHKETAD